MLPIGILLAAYGTAMYLLSVRQERRARALYALARAAQAATRADLDQWLRDFESALKQAHERRPRPWVN